MFRKSILRLWFSLVSLAISLAACSSSQLEVTPNSMGESTDILPTQTRQPIDPYPAISNDPAGSTTSDNPVYPAPVASGSAEAVRFSIIPGESQVTYEVGETFLNQGNAFNLAIGTTPQVSGDIFINFTNPQNSTIGTITVDISLFTSDSTRRDSRIRSDFLESEIYPLATFIPTLIEGLPGVGAEDVDYSLRITGDLTIREVTRPVTFGATIRLSGDTLTGTATTTILMSEFGVGPISIAGILTTQDEALLTLSLFAQKNP